MFRKDLQESYVDYRNRKMMKIYALSMEENPHILANTVPFERIQDSANVLPLIGTNESIKQIKYELITTFKYFPTIKGGERQKKA